MTVTLMHVVAEPGDMTRYDVTFIRAPEGVNRPGWLCGDNIGFDRCCHFAEDGWVKGGTGVSEYDLAIWASMLHHALLATGQPGINDDGRLEQLMSHHAPGADFSNIIVRLV